MLEFYLIPLRMTLGFWGFLGGLPEKNQALVHQMGHFELLMWDQHRRINSLLQIPLHT